MGSSDSAEATVLVPENLANFIEHKIKDEVENKSQMLATKEDVARARIDMIKGCLHFG